MDACDRKVEEDINGAEQAELKCQQAQLKCQQDSEQLMQTAHLSKADTAPNAYSLVYPKQCKNTCHKPLQWLDMLYSAYCQSHSKATLPPQPKRSMIVRANAQVPLLQRPLLRRQRCYRIHSALAPLGFHGWRSCLYDMCCQACQGFAANVAV